MAEAYYMDAVITPARSLSKRGLMVVMGVTVALASIPAVVFTLMGAPFVLPFLGIDILGLWLAFHIMNRRVASERVRVSARAIEVIRGRREVWSSATAFTRVEPGEREVRLAASGREVAIAKDLSPPERWDFVAALEAAIRRARAERYVS